jgi:hypothetical protein
MSRSVIRHNATKAKGGGMIKLPAFLEMILKFRIVLCLV